MTQTLKVRRVSVLLFITFISQITMAAVIRISSVSDLDFGIGAPGDPTKIIPPGTTDNSTNASFEVTGDANRSFTISLPLSEAMKYKQDTIEINNFTSYPAGTGVIGPSNSKILLVGATRAALKMNQLAGSYTGRFTVTVVY